MDCEFRMLPSAQGASTSTSLKRMSVGATDIAGAANNQLSSVADGERLRQRDILYAPDYVINAGGVISVAHEFLGNSSEDAARGEVHKIPERLATIFDEAKTEQRAINEVAGAMARRIVSNAGQ